MLLCRVTGSTVVTVRAGGMGGAKLVVVRPEDGGPASSFVAVDAVGAGSGDLVLVAQGSAARIPDAVASVPTDATVVGIVDEASHDPGG
ncbi:MAG: EutN/CcmL family microcompartment protein [bacterium]|nr:EutN/CcmL family microcompartment protein [bacterium]